MAGIQVVNHAPEQDAVTIQPGPDQLIIVEREEGQVFITIQDGECAEERIVLGQPGSTMET